MKILLRAVVSRMINGRLRKGVSRYWLVCLAKTTMGAWAVSAMCGRLTEVEREVPRRKKMHSLLVAGTFVLMVLSPCLVAMRSDASTEE